MPLTPKQKKAKRARMRGTIIDIARTHLPPEWRGVRSRTGSPVCGLLDILSYLKAPLPYTLKAE